MKYLVTHHGPFLAVMFLATLSGPLAFPLYVDAATHVRVAGSPHGWQLLDGQGAPWLQDAHSSVRLADDTTLRSSAPRYQTTTQTHDNETTLYLTDSQKQLDQTWTVTALDDRCFTFVLTVTNTGDKPLTLAQICPLEGTFVEKHDPGKPHILLNGDSTSKPLPTILRPEDENLKSSETIALESPALAAGFLTGKHNYNHFTVIAPNGQPVFRAFGDCNGCLLMPGASRQTDALFVSLRANPLEQLERYADLAGKINGAKIWPPRVAWCSWYAGWMHAKMATYKNGLEKGVEENVPYVKKHFARRGGSHTMRICDDYQPHGDWANKTRTIPGGFDRLARLISDAGIIPGVWYPTYWASTDSEAFKKHPEWFAQNKDGSIYVRDPWKGSSQKPKKKSGASQVTTSPESSESPRTLMGLYGAPALAVFDTSRPDVQQYFEDSARAWRERGFRYVTNDYLSWATLPPKYHDPTMTKVEVLRRGLEAVRRGLGEDVFYRTIAGPIGPRMGLANDLRISGDSHGDNPSAYYRTAQVWFYHRRLWLNDPSAVVCARYGELKPIQWNRMWMSWIALSGTVMTYGDVLDQLPEQYTSMYQRLFPPLPVAGRPLDLWENAPYLLWGMDPGEADGPYILFGVFDVRGDGPRQVRLNLDEVAARCRGWDEPKTVPQHYVLWDFWQQKLVESNLEKLELPLLARSCHLFALRPKLERPQLLGTGGHFSQGVVETGDVVWDAEKGQLLGKVQGNGGDPSTLFFHVPKGMRLTSATLHDAVANARRPQANVLAVDVPALAEPASWVLSFSGSPCEAKTRPFVPGRAATRFDK
ncbi:MAG: alpha-galactosidase [Planctomycetes bacterium]|nr:alpha-galactosidase [Planctomycetota bacterium]